MGSLQYTILFPFWQSALYIFSLKEKDFTFIFLTENWNLAVQRIEQRSHSEPVLRLAWESPC